MSRKYERHGMSGKRVLIIWRGMIGRCYRKNSKVYSEYGGRGIRVCEKWRKSFAAFYADMGEPPTNKHSLDRYPDKNGDYEPTNCRWATAKQQARNTRRNNLITLNGETLSATEWSERIGLGVNTIYQRVKAGLSSKDILNPEKRHWNKGRDKNGIFANAKLTES